MNSCINIQKLSKTDIKISKIPPLPANIPRFFRDNSLGENKALESYFHFLKRNFENPLPSNSVVENKVKPLAQIFIRKKETYDKQKIYFAGTVEKKYWDNTPICTLERLHSTIDKIINKDFNEMIMEDFYNAVESLRKLKNNFSLKQIKYFDPKFLEVPFNEEEKTQIKHLILFGEQEIRCNIECINRTSLLNNNSILTNSEVIALSGLGERYQELIDINWITCFSSGREQLSEMFHKIDSILEGIIRYGDFITGCM